MIVTTTPSIECRHIRQYLGVVVGEAIVGANIVKDLFAAVRNIVGGRSAAYEEGLQAARNLEMIERAEAMGANAIVGVGLDYEVLGRSGSMLMVTVSGTAVAVE